MENRVTNQTKLSLVGTAGLAFCGVLLETAMNVTFPTLSRQFQTSINAVQWVTTAYLLAVACTMAITAYLQRRVAWRTLILMSGGAFIVGDILCATATTLGPLLGGRLIQGMATGLVMPLVFAIIMRRVPRHYQGRYVGTAGMVVALAPSLGPTYGGWMTQQFGWPVIFWVVLPVGLLMWGLAALTIEQPIAPVRESFPLVQFILIVGMFGGLTLGVNHLGLTMAFWGPLVVAFLLGSVFVSLARHQTGTLLNLDIFTNRRFVQLLFIYFLIQFVQIGLTFVLPTYAQLVGHQSVLAAGMLLLAGSLLSAVLQPFTGRLLDRGMVRFPFIGGSLSLLVALGAMIGLADHLTVGQMIGAYLIYMLGFSLIFNNALTLALQQLAPAQIGDGNAVFNTLQQYAGSLGTAISSALLTAGNQGQAALQQTIAGARLTFMMMGILGLVIFGLSWRVSTKSASDERRE